MTDKAASHSLTKTIIFLAFLLGILVSWGVFSGDHLGRVNLIHLIILYVFLPIFSLIVSLASIIHGQGINFARLVGYLPLLPDNIKRQFLLEYQTPHSKLYFFYKSQLAALSFSSASLLIFILLLVSSDVNFVWRSTLMNADFIYPVLEWIAKPWFFWNDAQPEFSLLIATQESRLNGQKAFGINFGDWWQFILAGQIFYAIILRSISAIVSGIVLSYRLGGHSKKRKIGEELFGKASAQEHQLADVIKDVDQDYSLVNWGGLPEALVDKLLGQLSFKKTSELKAGPLVNSTEQLIAERWQGCQLVIVKGWEPPLGELADYLENGTGFLLPLDYKDDKLLALSEFHLDEWRRFLYPFARWKLLQINV